MRKFFMASIAVFMMAVFAFAQGSATGRLVGTVSGPDGALPGATVSLVDKKTGKERTVTTNAEGGFVFPQLEIGDYTVTVTAQGFKKSTGTITINVGQEYSFTPTLEIGGVNETVTITAGADLVNSSNGEISKTVDSRQLTELPLVARNPLNLILTLPGTASNPSQNTTVNGQRTSTSNITRDGINIQDNFIRSNATDFAPGRPSVDDVGEFTLTTQAGADRGFGGAQVELVTQRGQKDFHGTAFAYNRNSHFGANPFFANAVPKTPTAPNGQPRPFRNRNQFGGNISGPIVPEKLFFFGYYERLIDIVPSIKNTTTLTQAARTGIFTYTANATTDGVTAGQTISVNLLSLATSGLANRYAGGITSINALMASRFLSRLPIGNNANAGDTRNTTGYTFAQSADSRRHAFTTRIDYELNDTNSINGVFNWNKEGNLRADVDGSFNQVPVVVQPADNKTLSLTYRTAFSSNFTNELRGGVFKSIPTFDNVEASPSFFVTPPLFTNPEQTFRDQGRAVRTINVQDTADYIKGTHAFRFGGQFQSVKIDAFNDVGTTPTFGMGFSLAAPATAFLQTADFGAISAGGLFAGGVPTAQRGTANALLALYGGIISGGSQTFNATSPDSGFVNGATQSRIFNYEQFALFFQDQWRANSQLTLNLGVRWDYYSPLRSGNGLALEPVITEGRNPVDAILDPNGSYQFVGGNAGKEREFYKPDYNNITPIISFAWSPSPTGFLKTLFGEQGKTVIRGAYRSSFVNDELVRAPDNALVGNQGLAVTASAVNGASTALFTTINAVPTIGTPAFVNNRTYAFNNSPTFGNFGTVFGIDPDLKMPRVHEFSFGIQREMFGMAFEARYIGTVSNNLLRGADHNQVDIRTNGFLNDFLNAQQNCRLQGATLAGTGDPLLRCTNANYNPGIVGSVPLPIFSQLASGGLLTNSTVLGNIRGGTPADLAILYQTNLLQGTVRFLPNPNTGVADLLENGAKLKYNAFVLEARNRYKNGLVFNANYTFSKALTDAVGTGQTRFEPLVDNFQPELEYSRADFDQTHVFNFAGIYELPFGKGKQFLNSGGWLNYLVGGWQLNGIIRWGSGAPITIVDGRGTLNRAGRSGRQTALTNLTKDQLKAMFGVYRTPNGIFFLPPEVFGRNADGTLATGRTGQASEGPYATPFTGQIFFNNRPGQTSGLERAVFNGPTTFNLDASLFKNFAFGESMKLQLRGEMFNAFNNTIFTPGQFVDISSTNFGRITSTTGARVVQFAARFSF